MIFAVGQERRVPVGTVIGAVCVRDRLVQGNVAAAGKPRAVNLNFTQLRECVRTGCTVFRNVNADIGGNSLCLRVHEIVLRFDSRGRVLAVGGNICPGRAILRDLKCVCDREEFSVVKRSRQKRDGIEPEGTLQIDSQVDFLVNGHRVRGRPTHVITAGEIVVFTVG